MSSTDGAARDGASGAGAAPSAAAPSAAAPSAAAPSAAAPYAAAAEATRPARRPRPRLVVGLLIATLVLVSASLGAGITGMVAAGAAQDARLTAAHDLAQIQGAREVAEVRAAACLMAFAHDRAALEEMTESAGDLNSALRTVDETGWPAALVLIGSATEHLEASKKSIAQANAARCTG